MFIARAYLSIYKNALQVSIFRLISKLLQLLIQKKLRIAENNNFN